MIRAKTLLASVTIVAAAAITFALNSSHDEFVPENGSTKNLANSNAISEVRNTDPYAIVSHLPKLAPPPQEQPDPLDRISKTVIELDVPATIEETEKQSISPTADPITDSPGSHLQEKSKVITNVLTADRAFANLASEPAIAPEIEAATKPYGMPLPTRAPATLDGFELDTANPTTGADPQHSNKSNRRIARKSTRRRLATKAKKFAPQKVSNLSGLKSKPVRHREPFDANRN